jgi:flagellar hook-associated protein 3 FlgL
MITRVTSTQLLTSSSRILQAQMSKLSTLQQQASTGARITLPSDDPTGTGASMQVQGEKAANAQYSRNVDDGLGWLSTIDNALSQSTGLLQRARVLVLQAANAGTMSPQSRDAVAAEVEGIRSDLLAQANTQYAGRSVFAGTSDSNAYDSTTYAYSGTAGSSVQRRIGDTATVQVDADGTAAFGSGATSVFAMLDGIVSDLHNGVDVQPRIAQLDTAMQNVLTVQTTSGSRYSQMDRAKDSLGSMAVDLEARRSSIEDVDTVATLVQLQSQNVAYQSALQVTSKALPMSLLSFLS